MDFNYLEGYDPLAQVRASLGLVMDFSKGAVDTHGQAPPHSYEILKDIYFNDPLISTAVDLKAETVLASGWNFKGKNKREIERAFKEFERLNMYEVLLNFLKQAEAYGDAYLEPRINLIGKVTEVWPLETVITRINYDRHGEIKNYVQVSSRTHGPEDNLKEWEPDAILHFVANWVGSNVYSYAPHVSLASQLTSRTFGNHYITQIFKNLPPKMVHILNGANEKQHKQYKQVLLGLKSNLNQDLVARNPNQNGSLEIKQFVVDFTKGGLMEVLNYLREEVLTRMRVPPQLLGLSQNKGRTEPQMFLFETHIRTIQKRLARFINMELLPRMGLQAIRIFFPPPLLGNEEIIMRTARSMIDAGITAPGKSHPALLFLEEKGFNIPEGTTIEDPKEKDIDSMPSRLREGQKDDKEEKSKKDEQGDSKESREKIRKSRIRAVNKGNFGDYWENRNVFEE